MSGPPAIGLEETAGLGAGWSGLGHRDRLLAGMAASIKEKGFRDTTVADVVRLARTSRRTFYEHFADREDCFLALLDLLSDLMMRHISSVVDPARPWEEQVDAAIDAYLGLAKTEPRLMQSYVDEIASVGDRGLARERASNERFAAFLVRLVDAGRERDSGVRPLSIDAALLVVAGLRELTTRAVESDRDLMELRPVVAETIKALLRPAPG